MTCLLSQPPLGCVDPAAWHPVSQQQDHSLLPPGAAAVRLMLALEQASLRLNPLWLTPFPALTTMQAEREVQGGGAGVPPRQGDAPRDTRARTEEVL